MVETLEKITNYIQKDLAVMALFGLVALSVIWNTVKIIQKNYTLQLDIGQLEGEVSLMDLENQNLAYQIEYYKTDEFLELEARRKFNLAATGEKVLYLPKQQVGANSASSSPSTKKDTIRTKTNLDLWIEFFRGEI